MVFANYGFQVYGVDIDTKKLKDVRRLRVGICRSEKHSDFCRKVLSSASLVISSSYDVLRNVNTAFIAVPTPTKANGE